MRIRDPKATALIFASGKVVVTGTKSEEQARLASRKFARIVQKVNQMYKEVSCRDFKVQNMVAMLDMQFPIRLERLCDESKQFATYEPDMFPGLIYKLMSPRVSLLIFVSGKVVLSGAKSTEDITKAIKHIGPMLRNHRRETPASS